MSTVFTVPSDLSLFMTLTISFQHSQPLICQKSLIKPSKPQKMEPNYSSSKILKDPAIKALHRKKTLDSIQNHSVLTLSTQSESPNMFCCLIQSTEITQKLLKRETFIETLA